MVRRLRAGDLTVVNDLITANMDLAIQLSRGSEDNLEIALYTLTTKVRDAATKLQDDNIRAYLNSQIKFAILNASRDNGLGRQFQTKCPVRRTPLSDHTPLKQREISFDTREELYSLCWTDFERQVLSYRLQRYKDREIAEVMDTTPRIVRLARKRVGDRYARLYGLQTGKNL